MGYKVKRIYQGTNLVRPVWKYSYDFRNKSSTQLTNDGWLQTYGTLETGSSGVTSPTGKDVRLHHTADFSTAKKITITTSIVWDRNDSYGDRAMNFGITNPTDWNNLCQFYIASNVATYSGTLVRLRQSGTYYYGTNIGSIGTSSYTPSLEIDLVNKTVTGKISGYNNSTYSLSDAQVSFIRGLPAFYVYATQHNFYIQNVSITVEY